MHPIPPAECLACGTCCYSQLDRYVRVTGADWSRFGDQAEEVAHFIGNQAFMRMVEGHCIALRPDPGSGHFACSIYAQRPQICRDLSRGSPECLGELTGKAGRVPRFSPPSTE